MSDVLIVKDVQEKYISRYDAALDGARRGYKMVLNMACVGTIDEKRYARKPEEMKAAGVAIEEPGKLKVEDYI